MIFRSIALAAALASVPAVEAAAAVPGQFIAKMYTEALGRAPREPDQRIGDARHRRHDDDLLGFGPCLQQLRDVRDALGRGQAGAAELVRDAHELRRARLAR